MIENVFAIFGQYLEKKSSENRKKINFVIAVVDVVNKLVFNSISHSIAH